jgi:hypothetical protein
VSSRREIFGDHVPSDPVASAAAAPEALHGPCSLAFGGGSNEKPPDHRLTPDGETSAAVDGCWRDRPATAPLSIEPHLCPVDPTRRRTFACVV